MTEPDWPRLDATPAGRELLVAMRRVAELDREVDDYCTQARRANDRLTRAEKALEEQRNEFRRLYWKYREETGEWQ